jgi:protein TonB
MSEPLLSCPVLISRPRDLRRLRARAVSFTVAAVWFAGCVGGLLLFEILWAESSLPPHAVTVPLIFRPPPPSLRPSLPGGGGGPKAAVPPAPQKAPDRPVVVPLTPPLSDDELPPEPPPENNADIGATHGTGTGDGGPGDGTGGPGGNGLGDFLAENTPGLEPPIVIPSTRIHPDYPEIARKAKVVGSVLLLIVIDQEGRVGSIEVLDAPDSRFGFDLAAIEAVKRWRYRPARLGGRPVAVQASVRVEFTLAR